MIPRILWYALAALYPLGIFFFLVILKLPIRVITLFPLIMGAGYFLAATSKKKKGTPRRDPARLLLSSALFLGLGLLCFITNSALFLKLYPVLVNAVLLGVFASTFVSPPVMIFRLAVLTDKSIRGSLAERRIEDYCRKVTLVWCAFFVINGGIAAFTVFSGSDGLWSLYNGGISYMLIGSLFGGELIVRKMTARRMPQAAPLSRFKPSSRSPDTILCYDRVFSAGGYKTWGDFLRETAVLRKAIAGDSRERWILYSEDHWFFLIGLAALLQRGKQVLLTANITEEYLGEIRSPETGMIADREIPGALHIQAILAEGEGLPADEDPPAIKAEETVIILYTSGTTGRPKAVRQRLTELEADNAFVLSRWGEELLSRRLCSTVSPLHIYGLLFSVLLPFTAAIPFRRSRIQYPEAFEELVDDSYTIITVPAFLKRSVEIEAAGDLRLRAPRIFCSGGVLERETAEQTERIFGFWPVEIYGSTETGGIAWRESRDGPEWTPFGNARVRLNDEGCLAVNSPSIRDPAGFVTGDLAEILNDGRFLLKGRADSIVKIEEKRISLPEVEERLLASGLVAEACAVALKDKRQYLAVALALNEAGRERFRGVEKFEINRYFREYLGRFFEAVVIPRRWRYLEKLPADSQGKKKRLEIQALFTPPLIHGVYLLGPLQEQDGAVRMELFVPGSSDYFDDHFPEFKLLPAVAQVELALRLAAWHYGTDLYAASSRRLKFSSPVRPDSRLVLELSYRREMSRLSFTFGDGGEKVYSSGVLILGTS
ncbi:MAG: AMP-binding protein [Treponema sp.]|jgi:acyl-coenzyme A synthetase/AMP-(fatty) acid ligase/uncharacterized membrane protein|nr:AMP-binding protein [Treponema sp.]